MKRIILFDTSVATQNKGDEIIMDSVATGMQDVMKGHFVYRYPTHVPSFTVLQNIHSRKSNLARAAELKLICGTNLFWTKMLYLYPLFCVNLFNCGPYKGSVLLGVGYNADHCGEQISPYSKALWRRILSHKYVHSTRDDKTVEYLKKMGLKGVNTGCPTLWGFNEALCAQIPRGKADTVVFTLTTTGGQNSANDRRLISMLLKNYRRVYFWGQTYGAYLILQQYKDLPGFDRISLIDPDLAEYRQFLLETDTDYVGTRLHGGVFALQHKRRAIILSVDHRAEDFGKYNIRYKEQTDIDGIEAMIHSKFDTDIRVNHDVVKEWKSQFLGE